jgi:hypothetical protein
MNRVTTMTALLSFAAVATALGQTPSVTFLGTDVTTRGNWKGVYGQDGYVLADYSNAQPGYTTFNPVNNNQRLLDIWSCSANHTCDPRQLLKQPYSYTPDERVFSYYYNRMWVDFQINAQDGQQHRIALYFCDYEFYGREITVVAHNTATGATLDTRVLNNYSGGAYLVYNYTGAVDFEVIDNITPTTDTIPNATISGFFWGGSGGPPTAAPAGPVVNFSPLGIQSGAMVSGTVPIQVSLVDSPGVSSVQLQLDGQNLGAPMHYFVTDILATPVVLPFNYSWDTTTTTNCTHTISAIATDANGFTSVSPNLAVTVNNGPPNCGGAPPPTAAAPVFSPAGGTYTSAQNVTLTSSTSGASIRYTTDGSTPTETSGTLYTGAAINVSSNETVKAIAYKGGYNDSSVSSATYTINTGGGGGGGTTGGGGSMALVQSNAVASSAPGNINQSVGFASPVTAGDAIFAFVQYYNSAVPTSVNDTCNDQFTEITGSPVSIAGTGTARWFVAKSAAGGSCTVNVSYGSGSNYGGVAIFEVAGLGGASLTLDQSAGASGTGGTASASITPTQASSFAIGQVWSNGGGGFALGGNWTTQERTRFSTTYQSNMAGWQVLSSSSPVGLSTSIGSSGSWIAMVANFYKSGGTTTGGTVATPTFNPAPGAYTQPITISTTTAGATIRYTTNGTTPTETNGTVYSGPVTLTATTTLKAIAYKSGMTDSGVASGTYTVSSGTVATPTFNPAPGAYTTPVSLSTTTSGATIRYTTDGSTPTETNGTIYTGPITLTATTTIKAIAYESGFVDSGVASGTYTVGSSGGGGTPTFVQSNATASTNPSNSSQTVGFTNSVAAGHSIMVFAQYYGAATTASVSDSCHNTYTQIPGSPTVNNNGDRGAAIWFIARNVSGGSCAVTVSYASPTAYGGVAVFEVAGLSASVTLDQYAAGTGTGSTASASITPTHANSFAIAQVWSDNGGGAALGGSWTTQERTRFSTLYQSNMAGWQVLSTTSPVALATPLGSGPWIAMVANFY